MPRMLSFHFPDSTESQRDSNSALKSCSLDCTVSKYKEMVSGGGLLSPPLSRLRANNHRAVESTNTDLSSLTRSLEKTTSWFLVPDFPPSFCSHIRSFSYHVTQV